MTVSVPLHWISISLEQDILDLCRLGGDADPQQKFLAQAVDAGRTAQVLEPQSRR